MSTVAAAVLEKAAYRRIASSHLEAFRLGQLELALQQGMKDVIRDAYDAWIASTGLSVWDVDDLRRYGLPSAVQIDHLSQLPVAAWAEIPEDAMDTIPETQVMAHFLRAPTAVFPIKSIDNYPHGTIEVPVLDPMHSAVLHGVDVLRGQIADVHAIRSELATKDTYAALQELCAIYEATARMGLQKLAPDQYVNWDTSLPINLHHDAIPEAIARKASTTAAHRVLSLHFYAKAFARESDAAERVTLHTGRDIIDVLHERLSVHRANLIEIAEVLTRALARRSVNNLSGYSLYLALRTSRNRGSGPALFLVPNDTPDNIHDLGA